MDELKSSFFLPKSLPYILDFHYKMYRLKIGRVPEAQALNTMSLKGATLSGRYEKVGRMNVTERRVSLGMDHGVCTTLVVCGYYRCFLARHCMNGVALLHFSTWMNLTSEAVRGTIFFAV